MLTTWGQKIVNSMSKMDNSSVPLPPLAISYSAKCNIAAKTISGNNIYAKGHLQGASYNVIASAITESSESTGFVLGSDNTPASTDDYFVKSQITGVTGSTASPVTELDESKEHYIVYLNITLTNTNSESVTIAEIGKIVQCYCASTLGGNGSSNKLLMIDRIVLEDPVVIAPGESAVVRYSVVY